jgi:hypothetical protein
MEEDAPAVAFEAPEGAAEGFAGWVAGDVGEKCEMVGKALTLEVIAGDRVGGLGGERLDDGGAVPYAAGGAEFAEVFGEEFADGGWIFAGGGVLQAEFESDEVSGEVIGHGSHSGCTAFPARYSSFILDRVGETSVSYRLMVWMVIGE